MFDKSVDDYLNMQKNSYEYLGQQWTLDNRDPVVGGYDMHNSFEDYDLYLFPNIDFTDKIALEYGCGPGRNLIRFNDRFKQIDGVDIAESNIDKSQINLAANNIVPGNLMVCDGKSIPQDDNHYDVVFSTICLQHICVYTIRNAIIKDIHRVLKPNGYFCFQMGYGGKDHHHYDKDQRTGWVPYFWDYTSATGTNGLLDVSIINLDGFIADITNLGFYEITYKLTDPRPLDTHLNWIWVQCKAKK